MTFIAALYVILADLMVAAQLYGELAQQSGAQTTPPQTWWQRVRGHPATPQQYTVSAKAEMLPLLGEIRKLALMVATLEAGWFGPNHDDTSAKGSLRASNDDFQTDFQSHLRAKARTLTSLSSHCHPTKPSIYSKRP